MLTVLHGKEFYNRYIDTGFFDENSEQESCKVLSYSKKLSKVYYVTPEKEQGLILYFTKNENNTWEMSSWDCIWSKSGTAAGIQSAILLAEWFLVTTHIIQGKQGEHALLFLFSTLK